MCRRRHGVSFLCETVAIKRVCCEKDQGRLGSGDGGIGPAGKVLGVSSLATAKPGIGQ